MLHTRWSAEAWPQVKAEFRKAFAQRSQIRRAEGVDVDHGPTGEAVAAGCR